MSRRSPSSHMTATALAGMCCALLLVVTRSAAQSATPVPTPTAVQPAGAPPVQAAPPVPDQPATPVPTPTPTSPRDGTLDSKTLILSTPRSVYYAITYWSDGLRVAGYLGVPAGPGPFPAIVHNRGGYDGVGALTGIEIVPYVEAGYVAAASQYRGNGGGEGREDFGGDDVHDVTNLVTLLQTMPEVDAARIGMSGGSRGGMMTYLALKADTLAGRHDIKAAVTVGGLADLFMWDRQRGDLAGVLWLPLVGATPAQAPDLFQARSATYWPELINAPLLLLHGEADNEISIQQTLTLADLLRQAGKTVQVITFPGGDHPLSNFVGGFPDALAWFGTTLGGDGVDRSYGTHQTAIETVTTWFLAREQ